MLGLDNLSFSAARSLEKLALAGGEIEKGRRDRERLAGMDVFLLH